MKSSQELTDTYFRVTERQRCVGVEGVQAAVAVDASGVVGAVVADTVAVGFTVRAAVGVVVTLALFWEQ